MPPNHNLVNVGFTASASDGCDGRETTAVAVYGDEDDETPTGDGTFSPDASGIASGTLRLRDERIGTADGRVYLILVTARDSSGNASYACRTVAVPKDSSNASIASVNAQAAIAVSYCQSNHAPPPGYFRIGDGSIIGNKQ
jgi:hypothetical protein